MVENHYRTKQGLLISNMSAMQIKYILFIQPKITITLLQWALESIASCLPGNRCYLHHGDSAYFYDKLHVIELHVDN